MSADASASPPLDPAIRFRRALRLALAVAVGLCVELLSGSTLPFLAPLLLAAGFDAPANAIYAAYQTVCHQWAFRSFFLFAVLSAPLLVVG